MQVLKDERHVRGMNCEFKRMGVVVFFRRGKHDNLKLCERGMGVLGVGTFNGMELRVCRMIQVVMGYVWQY